jgi:hypothetical protein
MFSSLKKYFFIVTTSHRTRPGRAQTSVKIITTKNPLTGQQSIAIVGYGHISYNQGACTMRTVFGIFLAAVGSLMLLQPTTHADSIPTKNQLFPQPTISCLTNSCPDRSAQDVCHFGKVEWWIEGEDRRTRYNMYCEPACLSTETTCWISGFPEPGRRNFIDWTTGKKPQHMYSYDLSSKQQGHILEIVF